MARPFFVSSIDVEGSIFVMMRSRSAGFATVTSDIVSIRFRLAVRQLRGLCFTSIEPCLLNSQLTYPLLITLVLR